MLGRTIIFVFVVGFSISCSQAWVQKIHHKKNEPLYPDILDFNHEYMGLQDDMGSLPASYENLVYKLYNYLISPEDKYIKVLYRTGITFEKPLVQNESDKVAEFWKNISVESVLKTPDMRRRFVISLIQAAKDRLVNSCKELTETINPLVVNKESTALKNASELDSEDRQLNMKIILVEVESAKLVLQDLQNRVNFYTEHVLFATNFKKKIGGLSLQGLLRYTVSATTSVRGFWVRWKMMPQYSNEAQA